MRAEILPSDCPDRLVIFLPLKPNRRAGRKFLVAPDGATVPAAENSERLTTMQRALGRAFYWRREIESGKYEGLRDFARQNRLGEDYVYRQMTLTLLAPALVEGILFNALPRHVTLQQLYSVAQKELWEEQAIRLK